MNKWQIDTARVIQKGDFAKPLSTGFVAVDLGYEADPIAFTPDVIASEKAGLPDWRWQKEYERDWTAQTGRPVFYPDWLKVQRPRLKDPVLRLAYESVEKGPMKLRESPDGEIHIWLKPDSQPVGLPDGVKVQRHYGLGMDVSEGVGQSNSTIEIFTADNREQAAEFASNMITPSDLGRLAVALGKYFNDGLICCVRKMHGVTALRAMLDECGYLYLWRAKKSTQTTEYNAKDFGWLGGEATSPYLFGKWIDAIQYDRVILRGLECWQEHQQYIYDEGGRITHQRLVNLPVGVREKHGDRVIGCALAWRACCDLPRFKDMHKPDPAPYNSHAWAKQQWQARERQAKEANKW